MNVQIRRIKVHSGITVSTDSNGTRHHSEKMRCCVLRWIISVLFPECVNFVKLVSN